MLRVGDISALPDAARGGVLCVGNFDGVHAGHELMLRTGRALADERRVPLVVMTFDPHPSVLLTPGRPKPPLSTLPQRAGLLAAAGADVLIVVPTTRAFLAIAAEDFLRETVCGRLGAVHLVEGANFTFGRGARGTIDTLRALAPTFGFGVTIVPTVTRTLDDRTIVNVSSSLIRWLIERGRVRDAGTCLTRPYTLRGTVVRGAQRGRRLGYPTANLQTPQLAPAPGVYAGSVVAGASRYVAAISVGTNPTFEGQALTVEANLLDFAGDLYDQTIEVAFTRYLRDQQRFAGVPQLLRQLERDVALTRSHAEEAP